MLFDLWTVRNRLSGGANNHGPVLERFHVDKIKQVRDRWAFYRDRRPDAYDEIVEQ